MYKTLHYPCVHIVLIGGLVLGSVAGKEVYDQPHTHSDTTPEAPIAVVRVAEPLGTNVAIQPSVVVEFKTRE